MVNEETSRRALDFRELDEVVRDVEALQAGGYQKVGNWDLAQVCGHVADWMSFPLDGFPTPTLPMRLMLWCIRNTVGPRKLREVLDTRSMPSNNPTLPTTVPARGSDESAAVERLRQVVARFRDHEGKIHPSPVFGDMDREALTQLNLIHCAHHLSFLIPNS